MEPVLLRSRLRWQGRTGCLVCACLAVLVSGCPLSVVYYPERPIRATPAEVGLAYEDTRFETSDGMTIAGWWVPAVRSRGTVLYCHGNGGNISSCLDSIRTASRLGLDMFLFDYRGYGNSTGSPTEQGTYRDAEAAWDYLVGVRGIDPGRIIVWGRSLGGPVAARVAADHQPGVLIIESTFISVPEILRERYSWVPRWVVGDYAYDTRGSLGRVRAPVLVIHSPDDEIVPFRHGRVLYESIQGSRAFVEIRGSHNRGHIESGDAYASSIDAFVSRFLGRKEQSGQ